MFDRICRVLFLLASVSAGSVSASVFDEVALWLDAQDAGPVGAEVKVWRDHRGLPLEAKSSMDFVPRVVETATGKKAVSFGKFGTRSDMDFPRMNLKAAFLVMELDRVEHDANFLLGDEKTWDFQCGDCNGMLARLTTGPSPYFRYAVNGRKVATPSTTRIPEGVNLISWHYEKGSFASRFTRDRDLDKAGLTRFGGKRVSEALFFTRSVSEAESAEIERYLLGKWLAGRAVRDEARPSQVVWQIGVKDGKSDELALGPDGTSDYLRAGFGWEDGWFLVGTSKDRERFPFVLPCIGDSWAGTSMGWQRRPQFINILFDLAEKVEGEYRLVLDFADVAKRPPLLRVIVNGHRRRFTLPAGAGTLDDRRVKKGRAFTLSIPIPAAELNRGANEITLTSHDGSWAVFDDVRLEGPAGTRIVSGHQGAYVRRVKAGDSLVPGTNVQPLLVRVHHLDGAPRLAVELDGTCIFERTLERGEYEFEAPMPAVTRETESAYRVLVNGQVVREGKVRRSPVRDPGVAGYVDTRLGTGHSRWMLAPGPWMPFGMMKLAPDNEGVPDANRNWQGGYEPANETIGCFSQIHEYTMVGVGTMPTTGPLFTEIGGEREGRGHPGTYRSFIDKASEVCKVGYYAVRLTDHDIFTELTATDRCGFERDTFPNGVVPRVMFDLRIPAEIGYDLIDADIHQAGPRTVECRARTRTVENYKCRLERTVWYVFEFDRDIVRFGTWSKGRPFKRFGGWAEFAPRAQDNVLRMKSAISLVDAEGARKNLAAELGPHGWNFESVRAAQERVWNDYLSRIRVKSDDAREKRRFYTNLYRTVQRGTYSDVDGRWRDSPGNIRQLDLRTAPDARALGCDGFWGSHWNFNQLWNLVAPEWSARWVRSMMDVYRATGALSKGLPGMKFLSVMVCEPEIPLLTSAWQMGVRPCDGREMLAAMVKMQTTNAWWIADGRVGNEHLDEYLKHHYMPSECGEFSNTMETSYQDWCVAEFAKSLGAEPEARQFAERATWWRNTINPANGYCHIRNRKGEFLPNLNPMKTGNRSQYIEGNGWQLTFYVPQDVPGLIATIGRDRFLERLKWGFDVSRPTRYCSLNRDHNEVPVEHGNQQSMHFAWLFNWAGEPRETQARVRSILENYYGYDDTTAWLGDEDQGQMSAWFVMSALGLFQMDGGASSRPHYELGTPLFEEITIDLGHRFGRGGTFVIRAPNVSRERKYIQKAILNGKPVEGFKIDASEVLKGGELDFEIDNHP